MERTRYTVCRDTRAVWRRHAGAEDPDRGGLETRLGVGVSGPEWCAGRHGPGTEDRGDRHEQAWPPRVRQIQEFTTREAANLIDPVASMLAQGLHGAVAEGVGDILVYVDARHQG